MLQRRTLEGFDSRYAAIEAAGGMFVVTAETNPDQARAQIESGQVRALEVHPSVGDLTFLADTPLEFLHAAVTDADVATVNTLTSLRSLALDSWTGELDLSALPRLEWLAVTEIDPGQQEQLTRRGHAGLHHLSVGKYREANLRTLAAFPELAHLEVVDSRTLESLAGIEGLPSLRKIDLASCRALGTLDALADAGGIQHVGLERCNKIEDLGPVAAAPGLRSFKVDMRKPPGLTPFAGHDVLEFAWIIGGKRPAEELTALLGNPSMRLLESSREMWLRADADWEHVANIYDMSPAQSRLYETLHQARWRLMAW